MTLPTAIRSALLFFAAQLAVTIPNSPRQWLWRLFIKPVCLPSRPLNPPSRLIARLSRKLGVIDYRDTSEWVLRLLFLPSHSAASEANETELAPGFFERLTQPLTSFVTVIWEHIGPAASRLIPHTDYPAFSARLNRWAEVVAIKHPFVQWVLLILATLLFTVASTTPMNWAEQLVFSLFIWWLALFIRRLPGNLPTLMLMIVSLLASCRYIWWRATTTLDLEPGPSLFLGYLLFAAECYTWLVLLLGYLQTLRPLNRKPVALPTGFSDWPTVDVFIPTYNEPLKVIRATVFAAQGMDWPQEKLRIFILDDGRREQFREFAETVGVGYIIRPDNFHAKAGNLNHALTKTTGEFVAIFDCDHIPTRSFLQVGMGWFLKDPNCAMLQTPHHFFSPDPFERNLDTFKRVPNEGELFYGLIQDGNDLWNATFFCGSCAIIRRGPLEEIGGIAIETVTEDAHTALKLNRRGYSTAYLNITQAAGLATESLSAHIGQRIRWARGMAQIFRLDNPFLGKGLSFFQRLCYSNSMLHFFSGIPRLIFLTAPLCYLWFGMHIINTEAIYILIYALPHIVLSSIANSRNQGAHRHSFWGEVYESVLAWYITLPTTVALLNPHFGKFNVTAKGGLVAEKFFDWTISKPYILLVALNFLGIGVGIGRLLWWNAYEPGTVLLNLAWTLFNMIILGAAISVASEARQVRVNHRVAIRVPAILQLGDGRALHVYTQDYSLGGLGLALPEEISATELAKAGDKVWVTLDRGDQECAFPARVVMANKSQLGLQFDELSIADERRLVQCTFGRADAWIGKNDGRPNDKPLEGFREVCSLGLRGYLRIFQRIRQSLTNNLHSVAQHIVEKFESPASPTHLSSKVISRL